MDVEQIGRYQILEELGRGASGVVYRALDPTIGRTIAIKSIALDEITEPGRERIRERIMQEARAAGTLSHPNIVTIYDVLEEGDSVYIFMEFVDGSSLEHLLRQGDIPGRSDFLKVLRQISGALDYAHRKGIVHRDVKPANIVIAGGRVGGDPLAKMADFGVAKVVSQEATHHGSVIGTPNYMSPEQVQGSAVSGASDQFSLAVLIYEVLSGLKPFFGENLPALFYQICKRDETPVHEVNRKLTPTVSKVLQRALAKRPEERFATCGELIGALEFALGECPLWMPIGLDTGLETQPAEDVKPSSNGFILNPQPLASSGERAYPEGSSWVNKALLIAALCGAVVLAFVFIVRMNSGSAIPTQILDTHSAPASPPPPDELNYNRRTVPPLDLTPVAGAANAPAIPEATAKMKTAVKPADKPAPVARTTTTASIVNKQPVPVKTSVAAATGTVSLLTDPPGGSISVDNLPACNSPCDLTLTAGRHTLAATMSGFEISRKIFYVPADTSLIVPMTQSVGVLLLSSDPSGQNVDVDGKSFGRTPVTLRLAAGGHRVSVWDGSRWHVENVQIVADEVHTRAFHF